MPRTTRYGYWSTSEVLDARVAEAAGLDNETLARAQPPLPALSANVRVFHPHSAWIEDAVDGWVFAYRLAVQRGIVILAEVRVFPPIWGAHRRPYGRWRGDLDGGLDGATFPAGGITTGLLRRGLRAGEVLRLGSKAYQRISKDLAPYGWPSVSDNPSPRPRTQPGPTPQSDVELARVAQIYDRASRAGRKPLQAVSHALRVSLSTARGRIYTARKRGLLAPARKQGVQGGALTPKGRRALAQQSNKRRAR
jgi:hypothetical protein